MIVVLLAIAHDEDIGLLQVALRRRRERAGAQQTQQFRLDRSRQVLPVHTPRRQARKLVKAGEGRIDGDILAEPVASASRIVLDAGLLSFMAT